MISAQVKVKVKDYIDIETNVLLPRSFVYENYWARIFSSVFKEWWSGSLELMQVDVHILHYYKKN